VNYSFTHRNLSYAISAWLRRNNIAFHAYEHPYVLFEQSTGTEPDPRKEGTAMIAALVRFIQEWKRYNRSLNELSRLGDRELADIGISRSDIPRVAWNAAQRS
jgi:uncharacterized protein YjiS (DUF1127 family)